MDSVAELDLVTVTVEEIDFWNEAFNVAAIVLEAVRDWLGSPDRLLETERLLDSVELTVDVAVIEEVGVGEKGLSRIPEK